MLVSEAKGRGFDSRRARQPLAARALLGLTLIFLFVAPFAASSGLRATCLIAAAFLVAFLKPWRGAVDSPIPRGIFVTFAAWAVLAVLSCAWSSRPEYTLEELRAEMLYSVLAFAVFYFSATHPTRWRDWWLALMAGSVVVLIAKGAQSIPGLALWHGAPDGGSGPYSTHLVLVAALLPAIVLPSPWGFARKAAWLGLALLTLFAAAWSTANRIVWPALAVAFLVSLLAGARARALAPEEMRKLRRVIGIGAVATILAFAASIAAKNERFYRDDASITASVDKDLRPQLWSVGWKAIGEAPWLGHGFGREILAEAFLPETPVGVDHPPIRHAHNAFINAAVQLGIAGLALFLLLLGLLVREYARLLRDARVAALGAMGLALIAGFVAKNLTDDFLHRHNALVFWAVNGMLLGLARLRAAD